MLELNSEMKLLRDIRRRWTRKLFKEVIRLKEKNVFMKQTLPQKLNISSNKISEHEHFGAMIKPCLRGAPTKYYLFKSSPPTQLRRNLYTKDYLPIFDSMWRRAFLDFQLIYQDNKVLKRR